MKNIIDFVYSFFFQENNKVSTIEKTIVLFGIIIVMLLFCSYIDLGAEYT